MKYQRIAQLHNTEQFQSYLDSLEIELAFDPEVQVGPFAPLAQPFWFSGFEIGNRFSILPMEGWDCTTDGNPSEYTIRRWRRFGESGAKLIWGGEAAAVLPEGRANPNQMMINDHTVGHIEALRKILVEAHSEHWPVQDLYIGLQLTHSGRFCRPKEKAKLEPKILYSHPILNKKFGLPDDYPVLSDAEIEDIIQAFIKAAVLAQKAGFHFVDVKHCHGYLGHEFLSAKDRSGKYGGSFEGRTRFLREVVNGIRSEAPGLAIGVRLSAYDFIPFKPGIDRKGEPEEWQGEYPYAFGGDGSGVGIDLREPNLFLDLLEELDVRLVNITAGSPYYVPHIQRPAMFPPSDGYQLLEDPLVGVARLINATARLKAQHPDLLIVGTGYSYLQEWLPHVAQNVVRTGKADFVGLGRMALSYPDMPSDILAGREQQRKRICRTFSDCTTAPRNGLISGCFPLDDFYKNRPEADLLKEIKGK
jgi:2,4-dienoyl-CoA reductase-like NADH-dependent reductase (Old Yellow Enzyme family)